MLLEWVCAGTNHLRHGRRYHRSSNLSERGIVSEQTGESSDDSRTSDRDSRRSAASSFWQSLSSLVIGWHGLAAGMARLSPAQAIVVAVVVP